MRECNARPREQQVAREGRGKADTCCCRCRASEGFRSAGEAQSLSQYMDDSSASGPGAVELVQAEDMAMMSQRCVRPSNLAIAAPPRMNFGVPKFHWEGAEQPSSRRGEAAHNITTHKLRSWLCAAWATAWVWTTSPALLASPREG